MTIKQLRAALKHYHAILDMEDWKLTVRYQSQATLRKRQQVSDKYLVYGDVIIDAPKKSALITLSNPAEIAKFDPRPNLQLTTLMHELGHILFDRNVKLLEDDDFETGLDKFARCVVALHG